MLRTTPAILLMTVLLLPAMAAAGASQPETATISLVVETQASATAGLPAGDLHEAPGHAACQVLVPVGSDGGVVLDQATADGCISGWDHTTFAGERFVSSIDGLGAPGLTCLLFTVGVCDFWEHSVNDRTAAFGIDGYTAEDGDAIGWLYRNTF